jgi:hypothetical protein
MPCMDTPDHAPTPAQRTFDAWQTVAFNTQGPPIITIERAALLALFQAFAEGSAGVFHEATEILLAFDKFLGDDALCDDEYGLCIYCRPQPHSNQLPHRDDCYWVDARVLVDGWLAK